MKAEIINGKLTLHTDNDIEYAAAITWRDMHVSSTSLYNSVLRIVQDGGQFECDICCERFSSIAARTYHIANEHNEKPTTINTVYECSDCKFETKDLPTYNLHRHCQHGEAYGAIKEPTKHQFREAKPTPPEDSFTNATVKEFIEMVKQNGGSIAKINKKIKEIDKGREATLKHCIRLEREQNTIVKDAEWNAQKISSVQEKTNNVNKKLSALDVRTLHIQRNI